MCTLMYIYKTGDYMYRAICVAVILCLMPTQAFCMANPWEEGSRAEIIKKFGDNIPLPSSIDRCENEVVWRYLGFSHILEMICPRTGDGEMRVCVSRAQITGDYVIYSSITDVTYRSVEIILRKQKEMGNFNNAEFHVGGYNYYIYVNPPTDQEAIMHHVRSVIDQYMSH